MHTTMVSSSLSLYRDAIQPAATEMTTRQQRRRHRATTSAIVWLALAASFFVGSTENHNQVAHAFVGNPQPSPFSSRTTPTNFHEAKSSPASSSLSRQQHKHHMMMPLAMQIMEEYNTLLSAYPLPTQMVTASILAGVGDLIAQLQLPQEPQQQSTSNDNNDNRVTLQLPSFLSSRHYRRGRFMRTTQKQVDLERSRRFMLKGLGGGIIWSFWFGIADDWSNALLQQEFANTNLMALLGGGTSSVATTSDAVMMAAQQAAVDTSNAPFLVEPAMAMEVPVVDPATSTPALVTLGRTIVAILLEQFFWVPLVYTFWDIPVPTLLSKDIENTSIPSQVQTKLPGLLVDNAKVWTFINIIVYNAPVQYRVLISSMADILWQSILSRHVMTNDTEEVKDDGILLEGLASTLVVEEQPTTTKQQRQLGKVTV